MVQILLHMSPVLNHDLERWGSMWGLWGKREWLLSWFRLKSEHYSKYTPAEAVALQFQSKKKSSVKWAQFSCCAVGSSWWIGLCTEAGVNSNNCHWSLDLCWHRWDMIQEMYNGLLWGAHIWNVIHIIKDYLIFKNICIEDQYWVALCPCDCSAVSYQLYQNSSSLTHRTLQKRQRKPRPLAHCIVLGRKRAKMMHLYFLL